MDSKNLKKEFIEWKRDLNHDQKILKELSQKSESITHMIGLSLIFLSLNILLFGGFLYIYIFYYLLLFAFLFQFYEIRFITKFESIFPDLLRKWMLGVRKYLPPRDFNKLKRETGKFLIYFYVISYTSVYFYSYENILYYFVFDTIFIIYFHYIFGIKLSKNEERVFILIWMILLYFTLFNS